MALTINTNIKNVGVHIRPLAQHIGLDLRVLLGGEQPNAAAHGVGKVRAVFPKCCQIRLLDALAGRGLRC